jgi:hypothetical protein
MSTLPHGFHANCTNSAPCDLLPAELPLRRLENSRCNGGLSRFLDLSNPRQKRLPGGFHTGLPGIEHPDALFAI